jgi:uncharacterized tellurite resistance protein B-like protein
MLDRLIRRLTAPAAPRPDTEAKLALAALMVRVARADDTYAQTERDGIDRVLAATYALSPQAAADLRRQAEALETDSVDAVRFTRALKEAVPHDDRLGLLEALWEVVLSDGERDDEEEAQMRLFSSLLGFTDVESALARQRVGGA